MGNAGNWLTLKRRRRLTRWSRRFWRIGNQLFDHADEGHWPSPVNRIRCSQALQFRVAVHLQIEPLRFSSPRQSIALLWCSPI